MMNVDRAAMKTAIDLTAMAMQRCRDPDDAAIALLVAAGGILRASYSREQALTVLRANLTDAERSWPVNDEPG